MNKATSLGVASGLMIVLGYPGELILKEDELSGHWMYWFMAMILFCYVAYTLLIGRSNPVFLAWACPSGLGMCLGAGAPWH